MANTGNVFPGTGETVDRAGLTAWTSPGNVTADDAADATCSGSGSDYLVARNFDFSSIPDGSTILGVLVRVEASEHSGGTEALLAQLQDDAAALAGSEKTNTNEGNISGTAKSVYTFGSTSDLWGATLTSAIVKDPDFGVRLWFATSHDVRIDFVTIAIEYQEAATPKSGSDTPTVAVSEASAILGSLTRTDTPTVSVSETIAILSQLARTDGLTVSTPEAAAILASLSRADTASVAMSDVSAVAVLLAAADSLGLSVTDTVASVIVAWLRSDTITLSLTEARSILSTLSRTDGLSVAVADAVQQLLAALTRAETLSVGITEGQTAVLNALARIDTLSVATGESSAVLVRLDRADAVTLSLADLAGVAVLISTSDGLALAVGESAAIEQTGGGGPAIIATRLGAIRGASSQIADARLSAASLDAVQLTPAARLDDVGAEGSSS